MFIESSQCQCKIASQIYFKMSQKLNIAFENKKFLSEVGFDKQWPLAGEFSEFEYWPEIHHFWRIWVLAKMAFFGNVSDLPDSPTFSKPCCTDSQTHQDLPKAIFEKNVTRLAKFVRVIHDSREFGASGHCLEPTPSDEDQNSHSLSARKVSLESGALDRSAILTYILNWF
jgi:hypothetical protein